MRLTPLIGVAFAYALVAPALAQNSWTWKASRTGSQAWSNGSNWQFDGKGNGNSYPQNSGDIAHFQVNIAADTVVATSSSQVSQLYLGDTDGSHSFTLAGSGLNLSNSLIQKTGTATDTISAPITYGTLSVEVASASRLDLTGNLQGNTSLTKTGGGTLRVSGDYGNSSGSFTVSAGTLVIDSTAVQNSNLSTVSVHGGGTLAGSGKVVGATTFASGATHTPGNSPAGAASDVQTFSKSLTYQSGSVFSWSLTDASTSGRGTSYDGVNAQSGLSVASGTMFQIVTDLDFTGSWWDSQRTWTDLFIVNGATQGWTPGTLATVLDGSGTLRNMSSQGAFTVSGTQLVWTPVSAVPEASTTFLGILLSWALLCHRRMRALSP